LFNHYKHCVFFNTNTIFIILEGRFLWILFFIIYIILTLVNCRRLNIIHNKHILYTYNILQHTNENEYHQNQPSMSSSIVNNTTNFPGCAGNSLQNALNKISNLHTKNGQNYKLFLENV